LGSSINNVTSNCFERILLARTRPIETDFAVQAELYKLRTTGGYPPTTHNCIYIIGRRQARHGIRLFAPSRNCTDLYDQLFSKYNKFSVSSAEGFFLRRVVICHSQPRPSREAEWCCLLPVERAFAQMVIILLQHDDNN
jgi:hypothetical protein